MLSYYKECIVFPGWKPAFYFDTDLFYYAMILIIHPTSKLKAMDEGYQLMREQPKHQNFSRKL